MRCLFGLHSESQVTFVEAVVCARCGVRISEEVHPLAKLHESDD